MSAPASAAARKREPNRARQGNEPPAWMSWLRDGFVRTPNSFFQLAPVIEERGGSTVNALCYVHAKTAGGVEREDGTWAYPEWVLLRLDELASWLDGCKNTAWRAIQRCVKLGIIQTRKAGRYLEVRTLVAKWGPTAKVRADQLKRERIEREAAQAQARAAVVQDESAEDVGEDEEAATVILSSSGSSSTLRVLPGRGESSCPASSYCRFREAAIKEANKGRTLFAVCSPSATESKAVTESTVYTSVDDDRGAVAVPSTGNDREEKTNASILPDLDRMLEEWRVGRLSPPPPDTLTYIDSLLAGIATTADLRQRLDENSELFVPGRGKWGGVRWVAEKLAKDVLKRPATTPTSSSPSISSEDEPVTADTVDAYDRFAGAAVRREWESLEGTEHRKELTAQAKRMAKRAGLSEHPNYDEYVEKYALGELMRLMLADGRLPTMEQWRRTRHA